MKKIRMHISVLCLLSLLAGSLAGLGQLQKAEAKTLTGASAASVVKQMGVGWNLGNTFDATGGNSGDIYSYEQSWGNPIVTKELIDAVAAAGFTTIRIPVTWNKHIANDGAYTLDTAFLARVKTVVDYAYDNGMFVILNAHHEEWINCSTLSSDYVAIGKKLGAIWAQIADYFADYDQHLIFEGMNEPRLAGTSVEWSGNEDAYEAVNYLAQVFVAAVRGNGEGYNDERCLMIPGYAASNSASIMNAISLPTYNNNVCKNLIVSVHSYAPYDFCLSDKQKDFDPNNSSHTSGITTMFENLSEMFLEQGIPVVIGETSATNKGNSSARDAWAYYMAKQAKSYGVPIVVWDNGYNGTSGGECHAYFIRSTAKQNYTSMISQFMKGWKAATWGASRGSGSSTGGAATGSSVIWEESAGRKASATWDSSYISVAAQPSWFMSGREIALTYTGSSAPKLILDSETKQAWWIPVDPDRTATVSGKQVAYFTYDDMISAMKANGVTDPADLRNLSVVATSGDTTAYKITVDGGSAVITYMANGALYYMGSDMPPNPTFKNMSFKGWYTSRTYDADTKYSGETLSRDTTVYAKFALTIRVNSVDVAKPTATATATPTPKVTNVPTDAPKVTTTPVATTIPSGTLTVAVTTTPAVGEGTDVPDVDVPTTPAVTPDGGDTGEEKPEITPTQGVGDDTTNGDDTTPGGDATDGSDGGDTTNDNVAGDDMTGEGASNPEKPDSDDTVTVPDASEDADEGTKQPSDVHKDDATENDSFDLWPVAIVGAVVLGIGIVLFIFLTKRKKVDAENSAEGSDTIG